MTNSAQIFPDLIIIPSENTGLSGQLKVSSSFKFVFWKLRYPPLMSTLCVCAPYLGFWVTVIDYNVTTQLVRHTLLLANISPRDNTANKTSQNTSFRLSKSPVKCGNCSSVPATQICRENKGLILTCVVGEKTHWRRDLDRTAHIFVNTGALSKLQRARGTLSGRERPVEVPPSILL